MFEHLDTAPPDAILGLNVAFNDDPNPDKINLGVGVYRDETGLTPILKCVKAAEQRLVDQESSKGYLAIDGLPQFGQSARELLFGADHEIVTSGRSVSLQTPRATWMASVFSAPGGVVRTSKKTALARMVRRPAS